MKGHMQDGKFHPHTQSKGVRKSRDQTVKTQGVKIERKKRVTKGIEKLFEMEQKEVSKEILDREYDAFTSGITDYGSADIATAVEKFKEVDLDGNDLADQVREFADDTDTPIENIDVVAIAYDHILQMARNEIDSVLGFDIINDIKGGTEFYVAGNFMATSYDYSEEAVEQLREVIKEASKDDLEKLSQDIFVKSFLSDVDVFR